MNGSDPQQKFDGDSDRVAARMTSSDADKCPSKTVVAALDSLPDYDAETSDQVLADAVDPDALDSLFRTLDDSPRDHGQVVFPMAGYEVTVRASGEVLVMDV